MAAATPKKKRTLAERFRDARRTSTPLVGITTPDQSDTIASLLAAETAVAEARAKDKKGGGVPAAFAWDAARGLCAINDPAALVIDALLASEKLKPIATADVGMMLTFLARTTEAGLTPPRPGVNDPPPSLPRRAIVFAQNMDAWLRPDRDAVTIQRVWNLRELFKETGSTFVMLAPSLRLPDALRHDVVMFEQELPDTPAIRTIIANTLESADMKSPPKAEVDRAVDALRGLSAFAAEQTLAMSIPADRSAIDFDTLWSVKRTAIKQVRGCNADDLGVPFESLVGYAGLKEYLVDCVNGKIGLGSVILLDEIEKMIGAAMGDVSSVALDQLGALLSGMTEMGARGCLLMGPPGTGKTQIARALAQRAEVPLIKQDLGAAKEGIVGSSEWNIREQLRLIRAVSGDRPPFYVATSNGLERVPAELQRRFTDEIWFLDIPTTEERDAIWAHYLKRYELAADQERPNDANWTGAEVERCVIKAWDLSRPLARAGRGVVAYARSNKERLAELRASAQERYLSATTGEPYLPVAPEATEHRPRVARVASGGRRDIEKMH